MIFLIFNETPFLPSPKDSTWPRTTEEMWAMGSGESGTCHSSCWNFRAVWHQPSIPWGIALSFLQDSVQAPISPGRVCLAPCSPHCALQQPPHCHCLCLFSHWSAVRRGLFFCWCSQDQAPPSLLSEQIKLHIPPHQQRNKTNQWKTGTLSHRDASPMPGVLSFRVVILKGHVEREIYWEQYFLRASETSQLCGPYCQES